MNVQQNTLFVLMVDETYSYSTVPVLHVATNNILKVDKLVDKQ